MHSKRVGLSLALSLLGLAYCFSSIAATNPKITVTGKLERVMATGGESTGWAIQLDSKTAIEDRRIESIEVEYRKTRKLEELAEKHVRATGKVSHVHGLETGDRLVLSVSSIQEIKGK